MVDDPWWGLVRGPKGAFRVLGGSEVASHGFEHMLGKDPHLPDHAGGGWSHRLGLSERAVRRAITIIAALGASIAAAAFLAIVINQSGHSRQMQERQLHALLQVASQALDTLTGSADTVRAPLPEDLHHVLPAYAHDDDRLFFIADADGVIHALPDMDENAPKAMTDSFGGKAWLREGAALPQVLRDLAQRVQPGKALVTSTNLPDGTAVLAGVARLTGWPGVVVALQPYSIAPAWQTHALALGGILLGMVVLLIMLLALYNWQANQTESESNGHINFIHLLEMALQLGRCGLWDWEINRGRIFLTRSMRELLGLPGADGYMDIADLLELQHPEDTPLDMLLEDQLRSGHGTFEQEVRLHNASGTFLWLKLRGALHEADDGTLHLVGIAVDITAQKRAAAGRRSAEQLLDQAIESISESFALWDANMRLVKCNSKFREFHDLPQEACQPGRAYADIMGEARCRGRRREFRHALEGAQGLETVMELELENGRWLQISERQMPGGGFVSVGTDITELKRKQLELELSRRELEQTVRALEETQQEIEHKNRRLRKLARSYQQEKERAQNALRTKSQILANVSHELFTPLNHILMPADMMRQQALGPLSDAYIRYAGDIHRAGEEIRRKITDIMEYAELSTRDAALQPQPTDMAELLAEVVEPFAVPAEEKGVALSWRAAEGLTASVDARRLAGALRQLVSNAVNFTSEGVVEVQAEETRDNALLLQVRDTGCGMPPELLERIGEPFERGGNAYNSHSGGSGIGLAIARAVAEMHGGQMEVESMPGKGTLVRLTLPGVVISSPAEQKAGEDDDAASRQHGQVPERHDSEPGELPLRQPAE